MRSVLRWAGSKKKILGELSWFWNQDSFSRYIECFAGSASLYLDLSPQQGVINDINRDLIDFYKTAVKYPKKVHDIYSSQRRSKEDYYEIRNLNPNKLGKIDKAARFLYLNRNCFNGLYRTNNSGEFNVPYGGSRTGNNFLWSEFSDIVGQLSKAKFYSLDFEELIIEKLQIGEGDFVYLDPPYAMKNKRIYTQYGNNSFGISDIKRLASCVKHIDESGGKFLLSYGKCESIEDIFKEWNLKSVTVQRNIAGFAKNRRKDDEMIITNINF